MKKALIIIFLCIPLLQGCGIFSKNKTEILVSPDKVIQIDPKLLEPCEAGLTALKGKEPADLLEANAANVKIYAACRDGKASTIEVIKKLANIKEVPK